MIQSQPQQQQQPQEPIMIAAPGSEMTTDGLASAGHESSQLYLNEQRPPGGYIVRTMRHGSPTT